MGFKGGTRGSPIMPRDAVSRTANVGTVGTNGLTLKITRIYFMEQRSQPYPLLHLNLDTACIMMGYRILHTVPCH